jgi:hypothetical protein
MTAELEKCEALCQNCHRKVVHEQEREKPVKHGTDFAYAKGCRCEACKKTTDRAGENLSCWTKSTRQSE